LDLRRKRENAASFVFGRARLQADRAALKTDLRQFDFQNFASDPPPDYIGKSKNGPQAFTAAPMEFC
jgi:hypothetical protein